MPWSAIGRLPRSSATEATRPLARAPSAPRRPHDTRALLVDDNIDAVELIGAILVDEGYDVRSAYDATGALAAVGRFFPDVAVLDIGLPGTDGYGVAEQLSAQLGARAPSFIALSGYGQKHDLERSREAGFFRHLVKPVAAEALLEAIREAAASRVDLTSG